MSNADDKHATCSWVGLALRWLAVTVQLTVVVLNQ